MDLRRRIDSRTRDGFELPVHLARPLFVAARAPYPATVIRLLLERFGFAGLSYVVARGDGRAATGEIAWSTHPRSWSVLYRRAAYAAVDPRLTHTRHRVTPYLWDSADPVADGHARRFLQDAAQFGIRSGVVVSLHDGASGHLALTFDSALSPITGARREEVIASLGDLTLLAIALHEFPKREFSRRPRDTRRGVGGEPALGIAQGVKIGDRNAVNERPRIPDRDVRIRQARPSPSAHSRVRRRSIRRDP
jgi:hypothetical protein